MVRALGPTLGALGVAGSLENPQLKIFDRAGVLIAQNDDWGGTPAFKTIFSHVGAASLASDTTKDAAVLVIRDDPDQRGLLADFVDDAAGSEDNDHVT